MFYQQAGLNVSKSCANFAVILLSFILIANRECCAQEILPYEFVPLPAGTNVALGYYAYGHDTAYRVDGGSPLKPSGVEVNVGVARYVHYLEIAGFPALVQVLQPFGSLSGANIGGSRIGSSFGAQNTFLGAALWLYANPDNKTYAGVAATLHVPDGSYDGRLPLNLGDNRWTGNIQLGLSKGLGEHLGVDLEFDTEIYGRNNDSYFGRYVDRNPAFRGQIWLNWLWTPALATSLGWEGVFGGRENVAGSFDGVTGKEQRIRAAASFFITTTVQTLLEVHHDVARSGGFYEEFGLTVRVLKVF